MTKARDLANASSALSAVSATELGYVDGVTSAIQTQLDAKLTTATASTTYIPKSLPTAKGDLLTATASGTPAVLPVSATNGDTIVADSSTSTGLRYTPNYAAGKNKIINGDFGVWQRGTSFTFTGYAPAYTADRFTYRTDATGGSPSYTISRQTFTPGTAPVAGYEGTYFLRVGCTTKGTTANYSIISQPIEDVRTFAGQIIIVSFWGKASSALTTGFEVSYDQSFGSGGSSTIYGPAQTVALTTSWARYSVALSIPSVSGKTIGAGSYLQINFNNNIISNGLNIDLWGIQAEANTVATAFQTATGTIQGELAACQRYYWRAGGNAVYQGFGNGIAQTTTNAQVLVKNPVSMRTTPTGHGVNALGLTDTVSTTGITSSAIVQAGINENLFSFGVASGLTAFRPYILNANNSTSAYIDVTAEL